MSKRKRNGYEIKVPNKKLIENQNIVQEYYKIYHNLNLQLNNIKFLRKLEYIYNPTEYAQQNYEFYIKKYCNKPQKVMFLGMNPGPWGMSQTGVPFGEVDTVKNWMQIQLPVSKPNKEHPDRPVLGFDCKKSEVSGKRFWGLIKELSGDPTTFFANCFVYNYLPLQFISGSGKNVPPTSLKLKEQDKLYEICDKALLQIVQLYRVQIVVAIGKFAETRANSALKNVISESNIKENVKVVRILHPSPQSKAANNWHIDVHKQLNDLGIIPYLTNNL